MPQLKLTKYVSGSDRVSVLHGVPMQAESAVRAWVYANRPNGVRVRVRFRGPRRYGRLDTLRQHAERFDVYVETPERKGDSTFRKAKTRQLRKKAFGTELSVSK